jgi:hypothetical protein
MILRTVALSILLLSACSFVSAELTLEAVVVNINTVANVSANINNALAPLTPTNITAQQVITIANV